MNPIIFTVKTAWARIVSEPAVTLAVVSAAANAATVQTWQGYAAAVAVALLRFAVSPVYPKPSA